MNEEIVKSTDSIISLMDAKEHLTDEDVRIIVAVIGINKVRREI
jgi:hypothetical protein